MGSQLIQSLGSKSQFRPESLDYFPAVRINYELPHDALRAQTGHAMVDRPADDAGHESTQGIVLGAHDLLHDAFKSGRRLR